MTNPAPLNTSTRRFLPSWATGFWSVIALLSVIYFLGFLLYQYFQWGGEENSTLIYNTYPLPLNLIAALACWRVAVDRRFSARLRRAWLLIGGGIFSWFVGSMIWGYLAVILQVEPFPSAADIFYIGFYLLILIGLLQFPSAPQTRRERVIYLLNLAIIVTVAMMAEWYFVLRPTVAGVQEDWLTTLIAAAYPVADVALMGGIVALLVLKGDADTRAALLIFLVGLGSFVAADVGFSITSLDRTAASNTWIDVLWLVAILFFVLAAVRQLHLTASAAQAPRSPQWLEPLIRALPLIAIGVGYWLVVFAEWLNPRNAQNAIWLIGGAIVLTIFAALRVLISPTFSNFSLRGKLVLAFASLAIVSTLAITIVATDALRSSLSGSTARDLRTRAQAAALAIGITMDRNVDRLQTMSLDKRVQDDVTLISDSYPPEEAERNELIARNVRRWASADPQDTVIRNALTGQLAYSLRQFGDVFQGNKELFMTDQYGSVIATTDWRPDYNYRNDGWWQIAYRNGRGGVHIGQPEFNPILNEYGIRIALPIFAPGRQRVVGVLHGIYTLTALQRVLLLNSFGQSGKIDLLFPQGQILTAEGTFRALKPEELNEIQDGISQSLTTLNYRGTPLLSSQGVIGVSDEQPEPYLRSSEWRTIATIHEDEALSAVEAGTQGALLAGLATIGAAILVALLLAQFLTRPIRRLTTVAEEIQDGNLAARAPVETGDEIGALAKTFNGMTARLQNTLAGLERRVAERTESLMEANLTLQANSAYLSALTDTSTGLFERLNVSDLLQTIVERAGALAGTQDGFVFLAEPGDNEIQMRVGSGLYDDLIGTRAQRGVGLAGSVWQTGEPMIIEDYQKWAGRLPGSRRDALRAIVAVPLKRGAGQGSADNETIGVIGLAYTDGKRKFGKTEVEILQRFAQLASIALDNAQLYADSENRVQELGALNSISRIITQESELNPLLDKIGKEVCEIFDTDFAYVALYNPITDMIDFPYVFDDGKRVQIDSLILGAGLTSQVITTRQPLLLMNANEAGYTRTGAIDSWDGAAPVSLLSVPLVSGERVLGVLSVQRTGTTRNFTLDDQGLLTTIAASVGVGIENARLAQATQRQVAELGTLNRISSILTSDKALLERLGQVGRELHTIFGVSSVYIALYDAATNMVRMPFFMGDDQEFAIEPFPLGPGFTSHIIKVRAPLLINTDMDAQMESLQAMYAGEGNVNQSYLGVPILLGEEVLGVIEISAEPKNKFQESDVRLLNTIASAVASAIQNTRLLEQTQERARELDAVNSLAHEITQQRSLDDLFQEVYLQVKNVTSADGLLISLYDERTDTLSVPYLMDEGQRYEITPDALLFEREFADQVRMGEPVLINSTPDQVAELEKSPAVAGAGRVSCSRLYVPLMAGIRFLGMISLHSYKYNAYNERDTAVLSGLASHIAIALENARLFEQTQEALAESNRLYRIAEAANLETDENAFYKRVHEIVGEALPAQNFFVALYNADNGTIDFPYFVDEKDTLPAAPLRRISARKGIMAYVLRTRQALLATPREFEELEARGELSPQGSNPISWLGVPMLRGERPIGVVAVETYDPTVRYTDRDKQSLLNMSQGIANIIERKRAEGELQVALSETQRLAARERQAAEQVTALNRRLTREGWREYLDQLNSRLVVEAGGGDEGNGHLAAQRDHNGRSHNGDGLDGQERIRVPIQLRGEVIGEIELEPADINSITDEDMGLVMHVAENIGLALDNARLFTETQRRVTELDALNQITQAVTTELDLDSLLNVIGDQLREIFDVQNTYIALYDRETQMIALPYLINDNQRVTVIPLQFGEGIVSHIIRTRQPLVLNSNVTARMAELGANVFGNTARSYLGVPIFVADQVTGVISIASTLREGLFDESNVRLMETIAATVGAAIQNAQLYGEMQQEIVTRQRAEDEIKLSLREKEVLLKEIHHRVKNNLQIITSLLNLQSAQIKDPAAITLFRESQYRVRSMALIHEKLYQSKDLARIDFDAYVRDLMVYLFRSYAANPDQIRAHIETSNMFLGIDTAIPCGLIISELVTNTIKYAFPEGKRGNLYVGLGPEDDRRLTLLVQDDGVGFPEDFDWRESDSLGLQLVSTLASQLHGETEVSGKDGTRFKITFPG